MGKNEKKLTMRHRNASDVNLAEEKRLRSFFYVSPCWFSRDTADYNEGRMENI